jgi:hypothetical protein
MSFFLLKSEDFDMLLYLGVYHQSPIFSVYQHCQPMRGDMVHFNSDLVTHLVDNITAITITEDMYTIYKLNHAFFIWSTNR